jgi:hypothetical protein
MRHPQSLLRPLRPTYQAVARREPKWPLDAILRLVFAGAPTARSAAVAIPAAPVGATSRMPRPQVFRKARRSALIVAACVVGMPCGKSL